MFSEVFLAVTGREMAEYKPMKAAYLSCHFSPYGSGLSNLPTTLPPDSMILLDDSLPPRQHDPFIVTDQLTKLIEAFAPKCLLLDFQNNPSPEAEKMVKHLIQALPCPVAATKAYAAKLHCPVLLAPPPLHIPLQEYLTPWQKQGIYLEIAPETLQITVTRNGSVFQKIPYLEKLPLQHKRLVCHYRVEVFSEKTVFTITREKEDLLAMAQAAKKLGALEILGLYQELKDI